MLEKAYVYIFSVPTGRVKIGVSTYPQKRVREVSTGCPYEVTIEETFNMGRRAAFAVEKAAHAKLAKHSVAGEWFECSKDVAAAAIIDALDDFVLGSVVDADKELGSILLKAGDVVEEGNIGLFDLFRLPRGKYDDGNGLQVRVGPSTIAFHLIFPGMKKDIYLGQYPRTSLAEARKIARAKRESLEIEKAAAMASGRAADVSAPVWVDKAPPRVKKKRWTGKKLLVPGKLRGKSIAHDALQCV